MSIVSIDAGRAITAMAEAALAPQEAHDLYVRVEIRMEARSYCLWQGKVRLREEALQEANKEAEHWKGEADEAPWPDDLMVSQSVHYLFRRPYHNRQVFTCRDDSWSMPMPEAFTFLSEHDSCWRDAVNEPLNEVMRYCWEKLDSLGVESPHHGQAEVLFLDVARVVVTVERDHKVHYGPGRYTVLSINPTGEMP